MLARRGGLPVCSSMRFAAVSTSVAAGERGVSPVITMRGAPRPAIAARLTVATTWKGSRLAKRSAPSPPNAPPSVERKTSVCTGRTRSEADAPPCAAPVVA